MKTQIKTILLSTALSAISLYTSAQSVAPSSETIDKKEYAGLALSHGIPEKYLSDYWESYVGKFGKVKGKKGNYSIEKAAVSAVSPNPVQIVSHVSAVNKTNSKVFLSISSDGSFVTSSNDQAYRAAENLLKDFSDYAVAREQVRVADDVFSGAEKSHNKLQKELDDKAKEIEKTEKKLIELKGEVEKGKSELQTSLLDLQNKQKSLEAAKAKVPNLK